MSNCLHHQRALLSYGAKHVLVQCSSIGDLYEYDRSSKPSWKKHIWREKTGQDASLIPSMGYTLHGLSGDYSISLFLLTKVLFLQASIFSIKAYQK